MAASGTAGYWLNIAYVHPDTEAREPPAPQQRGWSGARGGGEEPADAEDELVEPEADALPDLSP